MPTNGDRHHGRTLLDASRMRPARLESALRRSMRDQCVFRAAFGHRRNCARHEVLDSQVLGRDDARRRAILGTAGVWGGHHTTLTPFHRARHPGRAQPFATP
jgi:hypothetical protein